MRPIVISITVVVSLLAVLVVYLAWPKETEHRVKVLENGVEWNCTKVNGEIIGCVSSSTTEPKF
jgi:hypothetical protein